ncbi:hypothetical protein QFZ76_009714 [Streptomyces sp. V4I2]|nr:hypothetical protein [Streptomyces sp. V4I2]
MTVFLTDADVRAAFDWTDAIAALRSAYTPPPDESRFPARTMARGDGLWLRTLSGVPGDGGPMGAKLIAASPGTGAPRIRAVTRPPPGVRSRCHPPSARAPGEVVVTVRPPTVPVPTSLRRLPRRLSTRAPTRFSQSHFDSIRPMGSALSDRAFCADAQLVSSMPSAWRR